MDTHLDVDQLERKKRGGEAMEYKKPVDEAEDDLTNDPKDTINPDLQAKSSIPFKRFHFNSNPIPMSERREPSENSLAYFMLRYGPFIPRPDPQPSSTNTTGNINDLPTAIDSLDFDLDAEVYDFAMNYDDIQFIPREYSTDTWLGPSTDSEAELQVFLSTHLWRDVNLAFKSAPDLRYYVKDIISTVGEDVSVRKIIAGPKKLHPKVAILELKTPSSLNILHFRALCSQQPSSADNHNKKILCQLHRYFKSAQVTWGAISDGLSTIFIRYEPNTKAFSMSDIIPHDHPAIIGYYCYWAKLGDSQQLDYPRQWVSLRPRRDNDSADGGGSPIRARARRSARLRSKDLGMPEIEEESVIEMALDGPVMSYGEFAQVNPALLVCQTGEVPSVIKLSYGTTASNEQVQKEIENYEALRDLWGSVLPQIYGMGEAIEDGRETGLYGIAMERLEKVDWSHPKRKVEAKQLLRQLHRRGFVHADVATRNFRWRSDPGEVVIIDLGCSYRACDDDEMEDELRNVDSFETSVRG